MHIDLRAFVALWLLLAAAVIVLAFWRRTVALHEDDALHLEGDLSTPAHQVVVAQKLEQIDKWGKLLTVIAVIYGLLLGAAYLYKGWVQGPGAGL